MTSSEFKRGYIFRYGGSISIYCIRGAKVNHIRIVYRSPTNELPMVSSYQLGINPPDYKVSEIFVE